MGAGARLSCGGCGVVCRGGGVTRVENLKRFNMWNGM